MLQIIWNRIAYAGVSGIKEASDEKYLVLLNTISFLVGSFSVFFLVTRLTLLPASSNIHLQYAPLVYAILIYITIYMNAGHKFHLARVYFSLVSLVFLVYFSYVVGGVSNFYLYFLTAMILQFFIHPAEDRHTRTLMVFLSFAPFVVFQVFYSDSPGLIGLSPENMKIMRHMNGIGTAVLGVAFAGHISKTFHSAEKYLQVEMEKSEKLLLNILPRSIADQLRNNPDTIADRFEDCTILFSDIVGFTEMSRKLSAVEVVRLLNEIFSAFDDLSEEYGLEKIKTIGDAYMVVGGLPEPAEDHAERVARFSLAMLEVVREYRQKHDLPLELRVGISSGEAVAGVIGKKKFVYDLWGDNVNRASRMESHGVVGRVQCTESTYDLLKGKFNMEARGLIDVKGMGEVSSYFLLSEV